jgi:hypothetical protein
MRGLRALTFLLGHVRLDLLNDIPHNHQPVGKCDSAREEPVYRESGN